MISTIHYLVCIRLYSQRPVSFLSSGSLFLLSGSSFLTSLSFTVTVTPFLLFSVPHSPPSCAERRALSVVYAEDADEYDDAMAGVCASMLGVGKESVIAVSTDFGPNGPAEDAARRGLMTSLRWACGGGGWRAGGWRGRSKCLYWCVGLFYRVAMVFKR